MERGSQSKGFSTKPAAPNQLRNTQEWFASVITSPLQEDSKLLPPYRLRAEEFITPSPSLKPHERIELYHQQYWWRLLKSLHKNFPFLARLKGYASFNQEIGIPYLYQHPPSHWALSSLGESLPEWLEKKGDLFPAQCAAIDRAANSAFAALHLKTVDFSTLKPEEILRKPLTLQPHIHLFVLEEDLFSLREKLLENSPEYWEKHPHPKAKKVKGYFVLYRSPENKVCWKEISEGEYRMLTLLQNQPIEKACALLEAEGGNVYEEAQEKMPFWFRDWTAFGWFGESAC